MPLNRALRIASFAASLAVSLAVAGCDGDEAPTAPTEGVRDYITALATSTGVEAVFHPGSPPAAGSGPSVTISGTAAMITGGSSFRTVASDTPFDRVLVTVDGVDGWWEVTLPSELTAEELVISLAQSIARPEFDMEIALGNDAGVGNWGTETVQVVIVGTGVVQVSVSWNTAADVDLYVVDPAGEEIYYNHRLSESGGQLDLDANAGCVGHDLRAENVTWSEAAPSGTYTVRVNLWSDCGAPSTDYVVTVRRLNQLPLTFTGKLAAPGVGGDAGAGTVVTTFTY